VIIDTNELKWSLAVLVLLIVIWTIANGEGYEGDICGGAYGQTREECL
jgi:hypothetical protein